MGTTEAELRLLWSPFSCPSMVDPLKHKQLVRRVDRKARSSTGPPMACFLLLALPLKWLILLLYFKTLLKCPLIREGVYDQPILSF